MYLDGNTLTYNCSSLSESWQISFSYNHSSHTVTVNMGAEHVVIKQNHSTDETNKWLIISAALTAGIAATAVTAIIFRRSRKEKKLP